MYVVRLALETLLLFQIVPCELDCSTDWNWLTPATIVALAAIAWSE
jgi:hypothetical protein